MQTAQLIREDKPILFRYLGNKESKVYLSYFKI